MILKQNLQRKVFTILLAMGTILAHFTFFAPEALAVCNYHIDRFDASGINQAAPKDTLTFIGTISRKTEVNGTNDIGNDCSKSKMNITIYTPNLQTVTGKFIVVTSNASPSIFSNDSYTFSTKVDLKNYSSDQLKNGTNLAFELQVSSNNSAFTAKSTWNVAIASSGSVDVSVGSGQVGLRPGFTPDKGQFLKDETVSIVIRANDSADIRRLPSAVKRIRIETYVAGKNVGKFEVDRSWFENNVPTQKLPQITASNYKDGPNEVKILLYDVGTNAVVGEGLANMEVRGLGTAAAASPAPSGTGGAQGGGTQGGSTGGSGTALDKCSGNSNSPDCVYNPLPTDSLIGTFLLIGKGFFVLIGAWAVLFIIIGGFRMVMAQGNEEDYAKAKKTITWAILGVVIASLSFSMVAIVQNLLKAKVETSVIDKTQTR